MHVTFRTSFTEIQRKLTFPIVAGWSLFCLIQTKIMRRYSVAATLNPRVCAFLVFAIYQMQLSITIPTFSSNCAVLRKMDDGSTLSIAMNNGSMPLHGLDKNVFVFLVLARVFQSRAVFPETWVSRLPHFCYQQFWGTAASSPDGLGNNSCLQK